MNRRDDTPSERLRRMAASDEMAVGRGRSEQLASRAVARAASRPRGRALVAAIAGSAFAIVSVTGVGALADQAAPGEALYAVDRAYESIARVIGRDYDRTDETLDEARRIYERGDRDLAIDHLLRELGPAFVAQPEEVSIDQTVADAATAAVADQGESAAAVTPSGAELAPAADAAADSGATEAVDEEEAEDPFLLAIQAAIRARQVAEESGDEAARAEADSALESVVKLAAGFAEEVSGGSSPVVLDGAGAVTTTTVPSTTTTTEAETELAGGSEETTGTTRSTTTTTVPEDSGEDPSGDDGQPTGEDPGDSQEGQPDPGDGGEPADTGQPPVTLPILP